MTYTRIQTILEDSLTFSCNCETAVCGVHPSIHSLLLVLISIVGGLEPIRGTIRQEAGHKPWKGRQSVAGQFGVLILDINILLMTNFDSQKLKIIVIIIMLRKFGFWDSCEYHPGLVSDGPMALPDGSSLPQQDHISHFEG